MDTENREGYVFNFDLNKHVGFTLLETVELLFLEKQTLTDEHGGVIVFKILRGKIYILETYNKNH